jgi:glycosyltransferase involved in cell wall biosynthesis
VTLAGSHRGFDVPPVSQEGTPLVLRRAHRVVPRSGFAGIAAPNLIQWLLRSRDDFDVIHIHLARDLVLMPFAALVRRLGIPFVLQPHGMIVPRSNVLAPVVDFVAIRRLLCAAHEVFYLTAAERDALDRVAGGEARLRPLANGVPLYDAATRTRGVPEVLYLSRLHARKRPVDFVTAALELNSRGISADYTLVGPDEGEAKRVRAAAATAPNIRWEGSLASGDGPARMRRASLFVLPSVGEPYPMAVLEAMSVGLPVVVTDDCGLAPTVRKYNCGLVIEPGPHNVAQAVHELLSQPDLACAMGARGRAAVERDLGMAGVGKRLEGSYSTAVSTLRRSA